ncbi:hypothetical protein IR083_19040 [Dysgonomonas sp. GY75]|uniref:helix-turn-helix transcriptional regulator n=1 Tax=Dysgonomonas sp. GY75 TaxID=2780419 RepID=UPI001883AFA9|nr:transposase [Dysgonomonas sp. GY75]MBF0650916.1 hypothetical protein [Dysgonomonas sp. GY75]
MAKYSTELTEKIVNLLEDEFFTVSQVCKATGISRETYYCWMNTKGDFRSEVEQAVARREAELMTMVHASLKKKLEGYYTTVEKDIYVPDGHTGELVFKQKTVTKKECPPDLRTIKMLLDRQDKNSPSRPPLGDEKAAKENTMKREPETLEKRGEPEKEIILNPAEEILETCAEAITEFPPKNGHIKKDMQVLTSSQKRKAEHKKKKNKTTEKIKKTVRCVRF